MRSGSPNVDVGVFALSSRSNLTLNRSSSITNTRAAQASVIMSSGFSNINIDGGTVIQGCQSISGGATIELEMASNSRVRNTQFSGNGEIDILADRSQLSLTNVTFNRTVSNSVRALYSNLTVVNSTFANGIDQLTNGKGIYCQCHLLSILNSSFTNLTALQGGAIYLTSSNEYSTFSIRNSSFTRNQAMQGGAIKLQDAYQLTIASNQFIQNSARIIKPVN